MENCLCQTRLLANRQMLKRANNKILHRDVDIVRKYTPFRATQTGYKTGLKYTPFRETFCMYAQ